MRFEDLLLAISSELSDKMPVIILELYQIFNL